MITDNVACTVVGEVDGVDDGDGGRKRLGVQMVGKHFSGENRGRVGRRMWGLGSG